MSDVDYRATYEAILNQELGKDAYIDIMTIDQMRAEMRALISMLEAERKFSSALQKRLGEFIALTQQPYRTS